MVVSNILVEHIELHYVLLVTGDSVVTIESIPALHHSVDLLSSPLDSLNPFWSFEDI